MPPAPIPTARSAKTTTPKPTSFRLVLDAASAGAENVTIFGTDYDTADGTCVRDYIHVTDLADAHVKALDALIGGSNSGAYNLGNGRGFRSRP